MRVAVKLNCQFIALASDIGRHARHMGKITPAETFWQHH
jgi:hypothetical protein|tara:strand:- start:735 stop:851 length:117 start_codon:yes stop_codon:yes gene_type:complete